jgi:multimeric flavodoxin WrbA
MDIFCVVNDDMQRLYKELGRADILVISTPVYFGEISAQVKLFIDRLFGIYGPVFQMKLDFPSKVVVLWNHAQQIMNFYPLHRLFWQAFEVCWGKRDSSTVFLKR